MLAELIGQIERITFTNQDNGYTIAKLKVSGRRDLVTVVGCIMSPVPGEVLRMKGEWKNHTRYGEQFQIVQYKSITPATVTGIQKYLGSGLIKGIGPIMAGRIVKVFGKDTLEVIENEIEKLIGVEGIGKKRIGMIQKAWDEQKEIRQVMIFLQEHNVSSAYAAKIFKQYGNESIQIVKDNPYQLAEDIWGIGFLTADRIAENLGFIKESPLRAQAGILYVLHQLSDEGHVYYPYEPLIEKSMEMLEVENDVVVQALNAITSEGKVVIEDLTEPTNPIHEKKQAVYLAGYYQAETNVAARIKTQMTAPKAIRAMDSEKAVDWVQGKLSLKLAEKQVEAIKSAANDKVLVITGGPGTGKTTIIKSILTIFSKLTDRILLAAPTGRAAKRMTDATGYEAKTIHRLLEFSPQHQGFKRNAEKPLKCELLVIDEASMIDIVLMHHLLKAIPPSATLILVGDVDQLPSVGPGSVLMDIINSGVVPVVRLNEIFRQAQQSSIIVNAHRINSGKMPLIKSKRTDEDFYFIEQTEPEDALKVILEIVADRIPKRFGFDPVDDIQVLSPMHRGIVGAGNLNTELQKALNPQSGGIERGGRRFSVNDKVMQIKNNYDKEVYNGDIGRIESLNFDEQLVTVRFDDRKIPYDFSELDEIVHAYAISVHKSQGSEFPAIVIPVLMQHYMLLQRNLLYTGITRGKSLAIIVGSKKALAIAVQNNKTQKRYTLLRSRFVER